MRETLNPVDEEQLEQNHTPEPITEPQAQPEPDLPDLQLVPHDKFPFDESEDALLETVVGLFEGRKFKDWQK